MAVPILAKKRIFDYLERKGLEKVTDVNAGDWHIYIVKELIDNALDADEAQGNRSRIEVSVRYQKSGHMRISIGNRSRFPLGSIEKVFSLVNYASGKDFFNNITRGQQGNGLKTVIGIPYGLHHFSFGQYSLGYTPVSIQVGEDIRHLSYLVDEGAQLASLKVTAAKSSPEEVQNGTLMTIRVAAYKPTPPPSTSEIINLARKYALFNPFAEFSWDVDIEGETPHEFGFQARAPKRPIYSMAPIHWYRFDQFSKLIHRLFNEQSGVFDLQDICGYFMYLDQAKRINKLSGALKWDRRTDLSSLLVEASLMNQLYDAMLQATPELSLDTLGSLGRASIRSLALDGLQVEGEICFGSQEALSGAGAQLSHAPYVLEVFIMRSKAVLHRTLWTGVNFTPLYKDPFYRKTFSVEEDGQMREIRGLDRILQNLGIDQDDNVLIGIHLICPNVEFQSYGKSEFDCRIIQGPLVELLGELAKQFCEINRVKPHENYLKSCIEPAANRVSNNGQYHYTVGQLFNRSCQFAHANYPGEQIDNSALSFKRFQSVLLPDYEEEFGELKGLIRTHKVKFIAPQKGYNRILWILKEGFEDVFISNDLVNQLQLAIMWSDAQSSQAFRSLCDRFEKNKSYTLYTLHDADPAGCLAAKRVAEQFRAAQLPSCDFFDLGLTPSQGQKLGLLGQTVQHFSPSDLEVLTEEVGRDGLFKPEDVEILASQSLRYDLNGFSVQDLLSWFNTRYLEVGILRNQKLTSQEMVALLMEHFYGVVTKLLRFQVDEVFEIDEKVEAMAKEISGDVVKTGRLLMERLKETSPEFWKSELEHIAEDYINSRFSLRELMDDLDLTSSGH